MIGRLEKNVIIARSGVYKYEPQALPGLKVQGVAPDGWESKTYYNVYRPANVVMQAKDKFVKLPLIREHQAIIDGKNFRDYALGWTGDTADIAVLPGSNEIGIQSTVNLIDDEAIKMYDEGFRDVSPLYGASFKWASGKSPDGEDYDIVMDDVIDVNHLAFTRQGRGGPAVAMDSEFNEADHPRKDNGQFGTGSGGGSENQPEQSKIENKPETKTSYAGSTVKVVDNEKYHLTAGNKKDIVTILDMPGQEGFNTRSKTGYKVKSIDGDHVTLEETSWFEFGLGGGHYIKRDIEVIVNRPKDGKAGDSADEIVSEIPEEAKSAKQATKEELEQKNQADEKVETLPQDTVSLDNVDFRTAIDDMVSNRAEYDADEIKAGVEYLHSLIKDIPDSEEKKILARLIDDFLTVKDAFPNDEAAKVAADSVVSRYNALDAKEDNMGLFSGKAKDAVPEETPAQEAPAKPEAPAPAPAEQAPAAPEAPAAPVPAAATEVAQMPDDVSTLDDAGLRACLNGVIKALKALMPEEAAEPEHQGEAPAAADAEGEKPPVEEEKKEGAAGDSVSPFNMVLGGAAKQTKGIDDFLANLSGRKGK